MLRLLRIMQSLSGQELRRRRLQLGITRDQLAHSVGVPPAMVWAWEEDAAEIACPNALRQILQQSDEQWPGSMDSMN
jgi:DNA-binding transcriptional regulator YiaG